jgi:hypothetical protein
VSDTWLTIEVLDGEFPATAWWRGHGEALIEAALTNRALNWNQHEHRWGVVVEVEFADEETADAFRALPVVVAVLDAVPDRQAGLLVYRGHGGGTATRVPRSPRPKRGSDAAALPLPEPEPITTECSSSEPASPLHA